MMYRKENRGSNGWLNSYKILTDSIMGTIDITLIGILHIFGDHDLLLILEAENRNKLMDLIDHVEEMGSVNASRTMLVATAYSYLMSTRGDMKELRLSSPQTSPMANGETSSKIMSLQRLFLIGFSIIALLSI